MFGTTDMRGFYRSWSLKEQVPLVNTTRELTNQSTVFSARVQSGYHVV